MISLRDTEGHRRTVRDSNKSVFSLYFQSPCLSECFHCRLLAGDRDVTPAGVRVVVRALEMTGSTSRQSPQFNPSSLGNVGEDWQAEAGSTLQLLCLSRVSFVEASFRHNRPSKTYILVFSPA